MLLSEFIALLNLKSKIYITYTDIASALKKSRSNISSRVKNQSEITLSEVKKIQDYFGINIIIKIDENNYLSSNTFDRIRNDEVIKNYSFLGLKLNIIQEKLNYFDIDMAKILNMTEDRYFQIKLGELDLTIKELFYLISRVDVSLDWLFKVPIDFA